MRLATWQSAESSQDKNARDFTQKQTAWDIINVLCEARHPILAVALWERTQRNFPLIVLTTVYCIINSLQQEGQARPVGFPDLSPHHEWIEVEKD